MPALSYDRLMQRALQFAINDREAMADSYGRQGEEAERAVADMKAIAALKGRKLESMTPDELTLCFRTLVFAEQWEQSLADANPGRKVELQCLRNVANFRKMRHQLWGKSKYEKDVESATSVTVFPARLNELAEKFGIPVHGPGDAPRKT